MFGECSPWASHCRFGCKQCPPYTLRKAVQNCTQGSVANALAQCLWALQKKSIGFCLTGILGNYAEGASLSLCLPCPTSFAGHGALKTTEEKAEVPSLDKEGWLRPLRKCRDASLAGADGHERSECEPDRAKQGRVAGSSHRLSEVERTTPFLMFRPTGLTLRAAPPKERDHLLDGAAVPSFAKEGTSPFPPVVPDARVQRTTCG